MGFFNRRKEEPPRPAVVVAIDNSLPDDRWLAASEAGFSNTVDRYYGTPDTMAKGGEARASAGDAGVALFFFRKSIDMLHTAYGYSEMRARRPSAADASIVAGFCAALEASLAAHPEAPVSETVREVTHRLRSIASECERVGLPPELYMSGLSRIAAAAPHVSVGDILWT